MTLHQLTLESVAKTPDHAWRIARQLLANVAEGSTSYAFSHQDGNGTVTLTQLTAPEPEDEADAAPDATPDAEEARIIATAAQTLLTQLAKRLWTRLYPERRPWEQLDTTTQSEWIRILKEGFDILTQTLHTQSARIRGLEAALAHSPTPAP